MKKSIIVYIILGWALILQTNAQVPTPPTFSNSIYQVGTCRTIGSAGAIISGTAELGTTLNIVNCNFCGNTSFIVTQLTWSTPIIVGPTFSYTNVVYATSTNSFGTSAPSNPVTIVGSCTPIINNILPNTGSAGAVITLVGVEARGFELVTAVGFTDINDQIIKVVPTLLSPNRISVLVPANLKTAPVQLFGSFGNTQSFGFFTPVANCNATQILTISSPSTICSSLTTISVSATGDNLTYLWSNGTTTPSFNTSIAGTYTVTVSGTCGTVVTSTSVSFLPNTAIITQPINATICGGSFATLNVSAIGDNLSYLWSTGATTSSITTSIAGTYSVTVSGTCGIQVASVSVIQNSNSDFCNTQGVYTIDRIQRKLIYQYFDGRQKDVMCLPFSFPVKYNSGLLYDNGSLWFSHLNNLYKLNITSGEITTVTSLKLASNTTVGVSGPISFNTDGQLHIFKEESAATQGRLLRIDTITGLCYSLSGSTSGDESILAIQLGPDGKMYAASERTSSLLTLNNNTGVVNATIGAGTLYTFPTGLSFYGNTLLAYSIINETSSNITYLYNVNTATGIRSLIRTLSGIYLGISAGPEPLNQNLLGVVSIIGISSPTTFCGNSLTTISVTSAGNNLSYIWSNGITTPSFNTSIAGTYTVTVSGTCGNVVTSTSISFLPNTAIVTQPTQKYVCSAQSATFSVSAIGSNLTYLWNTGANTPSFTTSLLGTYNCTVSGTCGIAISNTATLSLISSNNGLVAQYPLDGNANDISPNQLHGSILGIGISTTGINRFGEPNKAFIADNTISQGVLMPFVNSCSVFGISMWFNESSLNTDSYGSLFMLDNDNQLNTTDVSSGYVYSNIINSGNGLFARAKNTNAGNQFNISNVVTRNTWHHFYYHLDVNTRKMVAYFNGNLINSSTTNAINLLAQQFIRLGRSTSYLGSDEQFVGLIDDINVYNRELSPCEVMQLYNISFAGFETVPTINSIGNLLTMNTATFGGTNYLWTYNGSTVSGINSTTFTGTINPGTYTGIYQFGSCMVASPIVIITAPAINLNTGLRAHYPLNGNVNDVSGNGNHGTITGSSIYSNNRFLINSNALSINGVGSNNVSLPSFPLSEFTISFWLKRDRLNAKEDILVSSASNGFALYIQSDNTLKFNKTDQAQIASSSFLLNDFNWNYITVSIDKSNNVRFYKNGVFTNQVNQVFNFTNGGLYNISSRPINTAPVKGLIDEFRIYTRAINSSEVDILYRLECPGFVASFDYGTIPYCQLGNASISGLSTITGGSFVPQAGLSINTLTGTINLSASTAGVYNVEYYIPAQYGCSAASGFAPITISGVTNSTSGSNICADGISTKTLIGSNVANWYALPTIYQSNISGNVFTSSLNSGTVTVFGTNSLGCNSSITIFDISPIPTILTSTTSISLGSSLSLSGVNGDTWNVINGGGFILGNIFNSGSTTGASVISYSNATTGCSSTITIDGTNSYSTGTVSITDCSNLPFYLPILLNNAAGPGVLGLDMIQTYNPSVMTPTGNYLNGPVLSTSGIVITDITLETNQIVIGTSYDGPGELSGSGVVMYLEFLPVPGRVKGIYSIAGASVTESYDNKYNDLMATNGSIEVTHYLPTLQGNLIYQNYLNKPIINNSNTASGVTVISAQQACIPTGTITGSVDGSFNITLGEYGYSLKINRDTPNSTDVQGDINSADALLVTKIRNGSVANPTVYQLIAADVNGDGRVLSGDRTLLRRRSTRQITAWTNSVPDWKFIPLNHGFTGFNKNNVPSVATCLTLSSSIVDGCVKLDNQTFSGILVGDIDGLYNATPNGINLREAYEVGMTIDLYGARYSNGYYYVPVSLAKSANAIDMNVIFDNEKISIEGLSVEGAKVTSDIESNVYNNNQLLVAMDQEETLAEGTKLLSIKIKSTSSLKTDYFVSAKGLLDGKKVAVEVKGDAATSNEKSIESSIDVYPNPASNGVFFINVLGGASENMEVELFNTFGSKVLNSTVLSGKSLTEINGAGLAPGIYFLTIKYSEGKTIKKMIIK
ncbi:MAG: LamG-like jellyroll fold domain-containing protein [Bacteroidota bacterium]|nr:LamG-like jellyroll fold domain-containing protein [Bacteroidota bacterium]